MSNQQTTTYQAPVLIELGDAQTTIRGVYAQGFDIDTFCIIGNFEFQDDLEAAG